MGNTYTGNVHPISITAMIEIAAMKGYKTATCAYLILEVDPSEPDIISTVDKNVAASFVK